MNEGPANETIKTIPLTGPVQLPEAGLSADSRAAREAAAFADRTLEEQSRRSEHRRNEQFRDHIATIGLCVVWILFGLFVVSLAFLAWHYLLPTKWGWLDADQLSTLKAVAFSGAITSTATAYFAKRMN
jgi:hypothetical protein